MNRQLFHNMVAQYGTKTVIDTNQVLEWSGGAHCCLPSLKFYGLSRQSGTPTPDNPLSVYNFTGPVEVTDVIYTSTPPLHGIREYKDEWDYVTGKGVRRVKEIVLDGVINKVQQAYSQFALFQLTEPCVKEGNSSVISTHFNPKWNTNHGSIYAMNNTTIVLCRDLSGIATDAESLDNWNAWLKAQYDAGTPVKIYYVLAEPQPFEERPDYQTYIPIPNDSGRANIIDSGMNTPFEVTYITHS